VKLNEEAWDVLLVLVEPDREQAVAAAGWDVFGDVVASWGATEHSFVQSIVTRCSVAFALDVVATSGMHSLEL